MYVDWTETPRKPNQCNECGAFREDGYPPTVHRTGCRCGPDGSQVAMVRAGGTHHLRWNPHAEPMPPQGRHDHKRKVHR
jgi:hypothetical protein